MESAHDIARQVLEDLLRLGGVVNNGIDRAEVAGQTIFSIKVEDPRPLIGAHGDTIHALDYLVKKIVENKIRPATRRGDDGPRDREEEPRFLVDVNDYRIQKIKDLQAKALMMAERARSFQYDVEMSPMSAYERLIVHTTLQGAPNVKTESQGEGRSRRVVIRYVA
jgi:spoIIIJ-associated protein